MTTGSAFVYGNREDMEKEPKYILERHAQLSESAEEDTPAAEEAPAAASEEDAEIAGGEE